MLDISLEKVNLFLKDNYIIDSKYRIRDKTISFRKGVLYFLEQKCSATNAAKYCGVTPTSFCKYLKQLGIQAVNHQNVTKFNENIFDIIDTEEKAYFLGLMFADGNVALDKKRSPMISISLKVSDIKILQDFREILNMHSNLRYDKRKNKDCAILSFRSAHMAETLSKYGIIPNKTYKTKHLPQISSEFFHHFLRGLVDGDGSIYQEGKSKKYRIDYCSYRQSICEEFRELCNMFLIKKNTIKINNYGSAYHVRFNDQYSVKQLATVLYKDSKISLARKYSLAREIFEDNSEDDIVYSDH